MKLTVGLICLLCLAGRAQDQASPEGYGERWGVLSEGWIWSMRQEPPQPPSDASSLEGKYSLKAGEFFFAESGGSHAFRIRTDSEAVSLYGVDRSGSWIGPPPTHPGPPPARCALLAVKLSLQQADGGWKVAELEADVKGDWIAVHCESGEASFTLQALQEIKPAESWERLERSIHKAGDSWPITGKEPWADVMPGFEVGRFFRRQATVLPWSPDQDDKAARSLRTAHFLLQSPMARPLPFGHVRRKIWDVPATDTFQDNEPQTWSRVYASFENEVAGPCVFRLQMKGTWRGRYDPPIAVRPFKARVRVDGEAHEREYWPGVDMLSTAQLWDQRPAAVTGRLMVSTSREIRIPVGPGSHHIAVEADPGIWVVAEEIRRIHQADLSSPENFLVESDKPELAALLKMIRGDSREALGLLAQQDTPWAAVRALELATRLGIKDVAEEQYKRVFSIGIEGPLGLEANIAGMRYALWRGRQSDALKHAAAILSDQGMELEDCLEALPIRYFTDPGRDRRAWAWSSLSSDTPRKVRQVLQNVEISSARNALSRWIPLSFAGADTPPIRRCLTPIGVQTRDLPLRGDVWAEWLQHLSSTSAGPWFAARPEELAGYALEKGVLEILPADPKPLAGPVDIFAGDRRIASTTCEDPTRSSAFAWRAAAPGSEIRSTIADPSIRDRVLLWRSREILLGKKDQVYPDVLPEAPALPDTSWYNSAYFYRAEPKQKTEFQTTAAENGGLALLEFALPQDPAHAGRNLNVPFQVKVGKKELSTRRLLWLEGDPAAPLPLSGPVVTSVILLPPEASRINVTSSDAEGWIGVSELGLGRVPDVELANIALSRKPKETPPSGLWPLLYAPSSEQDISDVAAACVDAGKGAPLERARALVRRAQSLTRLFRIEVARLDFQTAESIYEEEAPDDPELFRIRAALAVLAFDQGFFAECRAWIRQTILGGGGSGEIYLLAAAAALAEDDAPSARIWVEAARASPTAGSEDLQLLVACELGDPIIGEPKDGLYVVALALSRFRQDSRFASRDQVAQSLSRISDLIGPRIVEFDGHGKWDRSDQLRRWQAELEFVKEALATGAWPPTPGLIDPLARPRDLSQECVVKAPGATRLGGIYGLGISWWLQESSEMQLALPGPNVYMFEWRAAHAPGATFAAPSRLFLSGLPRGPMVRAICAGYPSHEVTADTTAKVVPGTADQWSIPLPAGLHEVRIKVLAGSGFLTVREIASRATAAWGWPADGLPPRRQEPVAPKTPRDIYPRLEGTLRADVDRRVAIMHADPKLPEEGLTALADDLIFLALTRPKEVRAEDVLLALTLYERLPLDAHRQIHMSLARSLTRWQYVDLSHKFPEFRSVHVRPEVTITETGAVTDALFYSFPNDRASVTFDSWGPLEWHHKSNAPEEVTLELIADGELTPDVKLLDLEIRIDGGPPRKEFLEPKVLTEFDLSLPRDALLSVAVSTPLTQTLVRARLRMRVKGDRSGSFFPAATFGRGTVYRAPAGDFDLSVRGPTVVRQEYWPESAFKRLDANEWEPTERSQESIQSVGESGSHPVSFRTNPDALFRVAVRTFDEDGLSRRQQMTPPPVGVPPPEPDQDQPQRPPDNPIQRPVDHREIEGFPGLYELNTNYTSRSNQNQREIDDQPEGNEFVVGGLYHLGHFPFFSSLRIEEIIPENRPLVNHAELRLHHYFSDLPELDWRLALDTWFQSLDSGLEASYEAKLRIRYRQILDDQLDLFVSAECDQWEHSLDRPDATAQKDKISRYVYNTYRDQHQSWIEFETRARWFLYQNLILEPFFIARSNEDYAHWSEDRVIFGAAARGHIEAWEGALELRIIDRFKDEHRDKSSDETRAIAHVGYEDWMAPGSWLSLGLDFSYSVTHQTIEITIGVTLRLGGARGEVHSEVDPELQRFKLYQDAVYPWRRP